jgi:hypothetical protein
MSSILDTASVLFLLALLPWPAAAQLRCDVTPNPQDRTQQFCQNPNFPRYGSGTTNGVITVPLPANPAAQVGNNLSLQPGASNAFSLVMGTQTPGANLTTAASLRDAFYMNYMTGNLFTATGCPIDTGQACGASPFAAVARHYPPGDPNDLHVMTETGMALKATCTGKGRANCTPGNVYAGMVRVPYEIRPGMTIKIRYRAPAGPYAWTPIWLFSGSEVSPGPETVQNPYVNPYDYPIQFATYGAMYEVDLNDMYGRWYNNPAVPMGFQLDFGTPNIYGVPFTTPPYIAYMASRHGYQSFPNAAPPFEEVPNNWAHGFHNLVMSWNAATSMIYVFTDGKLTVAAFLDYSFSPWYVDPADGVTKQVAMHLIIGNQAIPQFAPNAATAVNNDAISNGWTITVQEISVWNGILNQAATPQIAMAGPEAAR